MAARSKIERPLEIVFRLGQAVGLVHLLNPRNPAPEIEYLRKAVPPDTGPRLPSANAMRRSGLVFAISEMSRAVLEPGRATPAGARGLAAVDATRTMGV